MDAWLDSLSEDWLSQPRSSSPRSSPKTQPQHPPASSVALRKPNSRIPRRSSGSQSSAASKTEASQSQPNKRRPILGERSHSEINKLLSPSPAHNGTKRGLHQRPASSISEHSVQSASRTGTVDKKSLGSSPSKGPKVHNTPEWKKRILRGELGYGDQRDLFSPSGLENIFHKPVAPSIRSSPKPAKNRLQLLHSDGIRSSPPPWPANTDQAGGFPEKGTVRSANRVALDVLEEQEEHCTNSPSDTRNEPTIAEQKYIEKERPQQRERDDQSGYQEAIADDNHGTPLAREVVDRSVCGSPELDSEARNDSDFVISEEPDLPDIGPFVDVKRGGYSAAGSFRRRALSPTSPASRLPLSSSAEPSVHRSLSREPAKSPTAKVSSTTQIVLDPEERKSEPPTTPSRVRQSLLSPYKSKPSGSPLKLFGDHDTFTNNRLLRRISQLEDEAAERGGEHPSVSQIPDAEVESPARHVSGEVLVAKTRDVRHSSDTQERTESRVQSGSAFGQHELDNHSFPREFSAIATMNDALPGWSLSPGSTSQEKVWAGIPQFPRESDFSPANVIDMNSRRQPAKRPNPIAAVRGLTPISHLEDETERANRATEGPPRAHQTQKPRRIPSVLEGKRAPTSPFKDSTPKRRRTSHKDIFYYDTFQRQDNIRRQHALIQSAIGSKPRDASYDIEIEPPSPEALRRRQVSRPRNPTPNQARRRDNLTSDVALRSYPERVISELDPVIEHIESAQLNGDPEEVQKTRQIAEEVAAFSLSVAKLHSSDRKRSVNTQDYLDEAMRIMHMIRNKGRPPSALDSVAEGSGFYSLDDEDLISRSTSCSVSPSPGGKSAPREAPESPTRAVNAGAAAGLHSPAETDEQVIASKFHGLTLNNDLMINKELQILQSPACNIRIIERPSTLHKRKHSTSSVSEGEPETIGTLPTSNKSHPSIDSSTGRTVATTRSQRSENVQTISPDAVIHLIPSEVAGMSFDKEKQAWVRTKHDARGTKGHDRMSTGLHSEEDPLGKFPDLSINERQEHDDVPKHQVSRNSSPSFTGANKGRDEALVASFISDQEYKLTEVVFIPSRSLPSEHVTNSGGARLESRKPVPSLVQDEPPKVYGDDTEVDTEIIGRSMPLTTDNNSKAALEVAGDGSPEDRRKVEEVHSNSIKGTTTLAQRNAIITVSSSREHSFGAAAFPVHSEVVNRRHDPSELDLNAYDSDDDSSARTVIASRHATPVASRSLRPSIDTAYTVGKGHSTQIQQAFRTRSITRIDEQYVASFNNSQKAGLPRNVTVSVLTPVHPRSLPPTSALSRRADLTFQLTPLSEFTLNQSDEIRCMELSYIGGSVRKSSGTSRKTSCPVATQSIVKTLTDIKPDEPFWEDTRQLDLRNRSLTSLHALDQFCPRTEELVVSGNELTQLIGVPPFVRTLNARGNLLSGLTDWRHLLNLQYLDVSGNRIDSLEGLDDLIHLRELRADNNMIGSLEGLLDLDGLIKLSLRSNHLQHVDFEGSNFKRLAELNLSHNELTEVHNLQCLPALSALNLDHNLLTHFPADDPDLRPVPTVRSLSVKNNKLVLLVMKFFPNVQSLDVDNNNLEQVIGVAHLPQLGELSMRAQAAWGASGHGKKNSLDEYYELRKLHLSANPFPTIRMSSSFLNLQYLELASVGLQSLPPDLGRLAPNLRTLNLNFNAIEELHPLLGMDRLQELLLAGNRVTRLRRTGKLLGQFRALTHIDLRDNPLTVGFYPPLVVANHPTNAHPAEGNVEEPDEEEVGLYVLPMADYEHDRKYWLTLDESTQLKRRVYEKLLGSSCRSLKELDGLAFDQESAMARDMIWERLLELGYVSRAAIE